MKQNNLEQRLLEAMRLSERQAWQALAGHKFVVFAQHATLWTVLNQVSGAYKPNPFTHLVHYARRQVQRTSLSETDPPTQEGEGEQ